MAKETKTDRLKKLEAELRDLEQWMKLGLVPKKELERHQLEIESITERIEEEKERMKFIKENGSLAEYSTPSRKNQPRSAYPESASLSDINIGETSSGMTEEGGVDVETENHTTADNSLMDDDDSNATEEETTISEDDEDPFSDKNRWRRGIIDPDSDDW